MSYWANRKQAFLNRYGLAGNHPAETGIPDQQYKHYENLGRVRGLVGQKQTPYEMSEEELFPGEDQATLAPGLMNKGTGLVGGELNPMEFYGGLLSTPGYENIAAQGLMGMMNSKSSASLFDNVTQDDNGQWWGVNKQTSQVQQIPMENNNFIKYKNVQSTNAQGMPITQLVSPSLLNQNAPNARITVGEKGFSDAQNQAAGFGNRMFKATQDINKIMSQGKFNPANTKDYIANSVPLVGNFASSNISKQYKQSQEDWVRAKLRKESGAVIGDDEMASEIRTYFPVPGDTPEVIAQKAKARWTAEQGMVNQSQGAYAKQYPKQYKLFQQYDPSTRLMPNKKIEDMTDAELEAIINE